jgi:hypothetical protein
MILIPENPKIREGEIFTNDFSVNVKIVPFVSVFIHRPNHRPIVERPSFHDFLSPFPFPQVYPTYRQMQEKKSLKIFLENLSPVDIFGTIFAHSSPPQIGGFFHFPTNGGIKPENPAVVQT